MFFRTSFGRNPLSAIALKNCPCHFDTKTFIYLYDWKNIRKFLLSSKLFPIISNIFKISLVIASFWCQNDRENFLKRLQTVRFSRSVLLLFIKSKENNRHSFLIIFNKPGFRFDVLSFMENCLILRIYVLILL